MLEFSSHSFSPASLQDGFSPTLKQLVELLFEALPLRFLRVSPRTVDVDHSNGLLFALTPVGGAFKPKQ